MGVRFFAKFICAGVITCLVSAAASAAVVTYTSQSAFEAAVSGFAGDTLDFDAAVLGDTIPSGGSFAGVGFDYSLTDFNGDPLSLVVDNFFNTTSPPNYLALINPRTGEFLNFVTGDVLTFNFPQPVHALGLHIIANDSLISGDAFLLQGVGLGTAAGLSGPVPAEAVLADGGAVYFLGMLSDQAFSTAVFSSPATDLEFVLDDVAYAVVPVPPALWLLAAGLLVLHSRVRRRRPSAGTDDARRAV